MESLLCQGFCALKCCPCCISVRFKLVFIGWLHRTVVFAAMRVVDFRGKTCLSESNAIQKVGVVPQIWSLSHFYIVLPCLLVSSVRFSYPFERNLSSKSCKKLKSVELMVTGEVYATVPPWFRIRKVLWGLQTTCTSCFLGYNIIKGQLIPCPSQILFNF